MSLFSIIRFIKSKIDCIVKNSGFVFIQDNKLGIETSESEETTIEHTL